MTLKVSLKAGADPFSNDAAVIFTGSVDFTRRVCAAPLPVVQD
jgi:hypothetical protein